MRKNRVMAIAIPARINAFKKLSGLINNGEITPAENQAAATVFRNSDKALSWLGFKVSIPYHNIALLFPLSRPPAAETSTFPDRQ